MAFLHIRTNFALTLLIALSAAPAIAAPVHLFEQAPVTLAKVAPGVFLVDFGRVLFGNLSLQAPGTAKVNVTVRFGEALRDGRVEQHPPGSVRFAEVHADLTGGAKTIVAPPADARNTTPPAVLTPPKFGVLVPFRWVEIEGWPGDLTAGQVRRRASVDATWNREEASFQTSDPMLDRVWQLCHEAIEATTFAGVFVDGDRERLAYEADAYLNQLSYYAGDADPRMPRDTFDRLMRFPTWPTEWTPHMVFMAYADWRQTGDTAWLAAHYDFLKTKLLLERAGADGLITSTPEQIKHGDIVDWPVGERDGFVFTHVNTVVNAFHLRALEEMAELADALGKSSDAEAYRARRRATGAAFQAQLFDPVRGLYRDGIGTDHASEHANLFPLAFGLVPEAELGRVAAWLASRGMAGSVYAAQYLLQALFENGAEQQALALMTAGGDRSWRHMVESGATITWEAWDQHYKPNQDWTHAWGAAPANLLPRYILGMQALTPGWRRALIQPHVAGLTFAQGKMPTPRGTVQVAWRQDGRFAMTLTVPSGMTAKLVLPLMGGTKGVWIDGRKVAAREDGMWWEVEKDVAGSVRVEER